MQIRPNFPAKSLSIYLENFSDYLFINLTENYLSFEENDLLNETQVVYWVFTTFLVDTVLTHENNKKIKVNFIENIEKSYKHNM